MKAETARNSGILCAAFLALFSLPVLLPVLLSFRLPHLESLFPAFPLAAGGLAVLFLMQLLCFLPMRRKKTSVPQNGKLRCALWALGSAGCGCAACAFFLPDRAAFFCTWAVHAFLLYEVCLAIALWKRYPEVPPRRVGAVCCICAGCFALCLAAVWGARIVLDRRAMADDEAARAAGAARSWQELRERYYHGEQPDPDFDRAIALNAAEDTAELPALWEKLLAKRGPLKCTRCFDESLLSSAVIPEMQLHVRMFRIEEEDVFPELLKQNKISDALARWEKLGDWTDTTAADTQLPFFSVELVCRKRWLRIARLLAPRLQAEQKIAMTQRLARAAKVHEGALARALIPELFLLSAETDRLIRSAGDAPRAFHRHKPLLGSFAAFPAYAAVMLHRSRRLRRLTATINDPAAPLSDAFGDRSRQQLWISLRQQFQETGEIR